MTSAPFPPPVVDALGFRARRLGASATATAASASAATSAPSLSPGLPPGSAFFRFTPAFLPATYQSFVKRHESASLPSGTRLRKPDDLVHHLLRQDQRDRPSLTPLDDRVDVHESGAQLLRHEPAHGALARPRQPDQHDVPFHEAAPFGVRARTCARYPAKFRLVSLSASPPNFASSACASTSAIIASAMTPMAGTAVTSDRSDCACAGPPVFRSTVRSGAISVEIGFIATRATRGSPVVMPPSVPPARLVARARPGRISSCTSEPLRRAASKPSPSSTPFTAGMDMSACARRPSSLASHDTWEPRPTGAPSAITSTTPPSVSPAALAASMRAIISCSAAASRQRTGLASAASFRERGRPR